MGIWTSNNNVNCNVCSLVNTVHLKYQSVLQNMELAVFMQWLWETGSEVWSHWQLVSYSH